MDERRDFLAVALEDRDRSTGTRNDADVLPVDVHVLVRDRGSSSRARATGPSRRRASASRSCPCSELLGPAPRSSSLTPTRPCAPGTARRDRRSAPRRAPAAQPTAGSIGGPRTEASSRSASPRAARSHTAGDQDRAERAPAAAARQAPAQNENERDAPPRPRCRPVRSMFISRMWTPMSSRTNRRLLRAGATADLLDAHEHEHHDLDHDRVEIRRRDDKALPARMEPAVRERRGRDARARPPESGLTTRPTVNGTERFACDKRPGEEREPGADHERARPAVRGGAPRRPGLRRRTRHQPRS